VVWGPTGFGGWLPREEGITGTVLRTLVTRATPRSARRL